MIHENNFDYLSGIVKVNWDAPEEWKEMAVLPFWNRPNDPAWGDHLSRVLYHEAIHFWQLLCSPYLLGVVGEMWQKLLHFENTGELVLEKSSEYDFKDSTDAQIFTVTDLAECWARYWDVHTRNALQIIREEKIVVEENAPMEYKGHYTSTAYDVIMTQGPYCHLYAKPYRWLLQETSNNSLLANVLFPILANAAFTTQNPVKFFYYAIQKALKSEHLLNVVNQYQGQDINMAWLKCWDTIGKEVIMPFTDPKNTGGEDLVPYQKAGYQEIKTGPLATHPIYQIYAIKADGSNFRMWFSYYCALPYSSSPSDIEYAELINHSARAAPIFIVFGLPGQPWYRSTLGSLVPPPVIQFNNYTWYAPQILDANITNGVNHRAKNGKTFKEVFHNFEPRIKKFHYAIEAVEMGLSPNVFDDMI